MRVRAAKTSTLVPVTRLSKGDAFRQCAVECPPNCNEHVWMVCEGDPVTAVNLATGETRTAYSMQEVEPVDAEVVVPCR